ncbi:glycosyltransferase family 39 protein [Candidatus Roizmanbacteria bacterium]|nr:glycosyltransferase family 39 protein [Candidatus Roizmanbacteria bacterium]
MKKNFATLLLITIISFIFFTAIGFDVTPYLRGPGIYPPDWRWPYQFTNTIGTLWFPAIIIFSILCFYLYLEKISENQINKQQGIILFLIVILHMLLQISILFFSRAGIGILLQRIIHPGMNGYFTTALSIKSIPQFLTTFNQNVLSFPMHATGHPPGSILFFWLINKFAVILIPFPTIISSIHFSHQDIQSIWQLLTLDQKTGAIIAAGLIPFLSSLSIPLIFLLGKVFYSVRATIRSVFLYMIIPSVILFIPLSDVFFPLFFLSSFLVFIQGLSKKNSVYLFLSGILFFVGLFFSMSLLPLLFLFIYFIIFNSHKQRKINIKKLIHYSFILMGGLLILPILLFMFFHFNSFEVAKTLISGLPKGRQYHVWFFYNLYDFFVFVGIPLSILYLKMIFLRIKDHLFIAFTIMLFLLNFSGTVRGEVARIWLPFISILVLFLSSFVTDSLKMNRKYFICVLLLQAAQLLVMQEFWVPLW